MESRMPRIFFFSFYFKALQLPLWIAISLTGEKNPEIKCIRIYLFFSKKETAVSFSQCHNLVVE